MGFKLLTFWQSLFYTLAIVTFLSHKNKSVSKRLLNIVQRLLDMPFYWNLYIVVHVYFPILSFFVRNMISAMSGKVLLTSPIYTRK